MKIISQNTHYDDRDDGVIAVRQGDDVEVATRGVGARAEQRS